MDKIGTTSRQRLPASGLTIEEVRAAYFDADALRVTPEPLYRIDGNGWRYYYAMREDGPQFYISATSLVGATLPQSPFLIQWMKEQGERADEIRDTKAAYGTLMHVLVSRLIIDRSLSVDFDALDSEVRAYMQREGLTYNTDGWAARLQRDLVALAAWLVERKAKPLAVEIMLASKDGYAGTIDLVCEMEDMEEVMVLNENPRSKYCGQMVKEKRSCTVRAMIDWKSGGIWDSHAVQMELYRRIWEEHFPELPIGRMYNVSPKDWLTAPGCTEKDQSGAPLRAAVPILLDLWKIIGRPQPTLRQRIDGTITLDGDPSACVKSQDIMSVATGAARHMGADIEALPSFAGAGDGLETETKEAA